METEPLATNPESAESEIIEKEAVDTETVDTEAVETESVETEAAQPDAVQPEDGLSSAEPDEAISGHAEVDTEPAAELTDEGGDNTLSEIKRKQHFTGVVKRILLAGAVVDIGVGVPGVVHISQLSAEPVNRVEDVVQLGQSVEVWVRRVFPKKDRIELTMIKPLDLEWREIEKDMVVKGTVTRLEKFGAFVEIGAERPGLVHISEMTHDYIKSPSEVVKEGDEVEVKVLSVNRHKKQIKLSMKALLEPPIKVAKEVQQRPSREKPAEPPQEVEKEEPIPSAMEFALRQAMERSKERQHEEAPSKGKRKHTSKDELEDILSRTLKHRSRSGK